MANQWTLHENKLLEDAIAANPELFTRGEWDEIAKLIPSKTAEEIKLHYENRQQDDMEMVECRYPGRQYSHEELKEDIARILEGSIRPPLILRPPKEEGLEEALRERGYELKKETP